MAVDADDFEGEPTRAAFAVRVAEDHQVVGIFVADGLDHLAHLVDQCCDPAGTEYLRLGMGGFYVGGRTNARWPARDIRNVSGEVIDIEPVDSDPLAGGTLDDYWWRDVQEGDWFPLVWDRTLPKRPSRRTSKAAR